MSEEESEGGRGGVYGKMCVRARVCVSVIITLQTVERV